MLRSAAPTPMPVRYRTRPGAPAPVVPVRHPVLHERSVVHERVVRLLCRCPAARRSRVFRVRAVPGRCPAVPGQAARLRCPALRRWPVARVPQAPGRRHTRPVVLVRTGQRRHLRPMSPVGASGPERSHRASSGGDRRRRTPSRGGHPGGPASRRSRSEGTASRRAVPRQRPSERSWSRYRPSGGPGHRYRPSGGSCDRPGHGYRPSGGSATGPVTGTARPPVPSDDPRRAAGPEGGRRPGTTRRRRPPARRCGWGRRGGGGCPCHRAGRTTGVGRRRPAGGRPRRCVHPTGRRRRVSPRSRRPVGVRRPGCGPGDATGRRPVRSGRGDRRAAAPGGPGRPGRRRRRRLRRCRGRVAARGNDVVCGWASWCWSAWCCSGRSRSTSGCGR